MRVQITLCITDGDYTLFDGVSEECPPIPRSGDRIRYDDAKSVQIEGVQYLYTDSGIEVQLLA